MQVSNVLGTCRQLMQLLISYLKLSQTNITARPTAVKAPHSGDWLNALPITSCGLRMEDNAIRVAVGLNLDANLCELHQFTCGNMVNTRGNLWLVMKKECWENFKTQLPERFYLPCSVTSRTAIDQRTCRVTSF